MYEIKAKRTPGNVAWHNVERQQATGVERIKPVLNEELLPVSNKPMVSVDVK